MTNSTHMGMNRTGIQMSPVHSKQMMRNSDDVTADLSGMTKLVAYKRDRLQSADVVGSVPLPGTFKGVLSSLKDKVAGKNAEVLINKLGERLAFERTGVRLYDAMIAKCQVKANAQAGAVFSVEDLLALRNEELAHFSMLCDCMESIGADPTAQTPDADVAGVAVTGVLKVLTDPRTNVLQCLSALLTAELTDHASWELLVSLAEEMGMQEMAEQFRGALQQEADHLSKVKQWYSQLTLSEGGVAPGTRH